MKKTDTGAKAKTVNGIRPVTQAERNRFGASPKIGKAANSRIPSTGAELDAVIDRYRSVSTLSQQQNQGKGK